MRLAWFTPWPPQPSGVARCSADLVTALAARGWAIDVFVDERRVPVTASHDADAGVPGAVRVQSAHDFVWRASRQQYDLAVYQVGNSRLHDYLWPYLFRWPGLAVLHDGRLHHARARTLLIPGSEDDYRAEFAFSQPGTSPDASELAVRGFDGPYYYLWPMVRSIQAASRWTASHTRSAPADDVADCPASQLEFIPLGHGRTDPPVESARRDARVAFGLPADRVLFGLFGGLSPDKRVAEILTAFARTWRRNPAVHLVLAGAPDRRVDVQAQTEALSIAGAVTHLGVLDDPAFDRAIDAVDVSINLRWPTARETSGPWLRALAAGRATITTALAHQAHVPALDPRDWRPLDPASAHPPVTVAIDLLDEVHSLGLAMDRLAIDPVLRDELGRSARRYWEREHSLDRMVDVYEQVLRRAITLPAPAAVLPDALRPLPWRSVADRLAPFEEVTCELF